MEERRSREKIIPLEIYTDGSLKKIGKKTFGAWGFIAVRDDKEFYRASGVEYDTTNQRMELLGAIKGVQYASQARRPSEKVILYCDSAYIINCYREEWYLKWLENGWINSQKKSVANIDLWEQLIPYFDNFWYYFDKIKGHAGNYWNETCDELVQREAQSLKNNWRG